MYRVALIYCGRQPFDQKVMSGVARYRHEFDEFITYIEDDFPNRRSISDLEAWKGDGIIANFDSPLIAEVVLQTDIPVVAFGGWYGSFPRRSKIPYLLSDQKNIGQLAADHLLERGYQHFGYVGYRDASTTAWSVERQNAFVTRVQSRGFDCAVYQEDCTATWSAAQTSLGEWLNAIPKPVGIMGAHDKLARQVLESCRANDFRVPQDVAIVGVDNDEVLCQLCTPALSSIEQDAKRIGYEAAALLHRMLKGNKPPKTCSPFAPLTVVMRKSSDFFSVSDPMVQKALDLIRSRYSTLTKVGQIANALAVSNTNLESRFRDALGVTVHHAIRRIRLEEVRQLLAGTDTAIKEIAASAGFKSVQQMTTLFGKAYGKSPAKYRKDLSF